MICSGPVTLRPIEYRDMELLRGLLNDPEIALSVVGFGFPVSSEQQREWFEQVSPKETALRFMAEAGGCTVGTVVFSKIDTDNMTGDLGYKILREYQGRHYAYHAVCAALEYLFREKKFECITACHLHSNLASGRVLERAGFVLEGVLRQAVYRNGSRMDLWHWSITRELFNQKEGG